MSKSAVSNNFRVIHRYLGFFLAGIMAVYAISGISLIFRDTDAFKKRIEFDKVVEKNIEQAALGKVLEVRKLKVTKEEGGIYYFKEGTYNSKTGEAKYTIMKMPKVLDKMQHLHKAKSAEPLFFLNIFFGLALLFFVISAFWMFMPSSSIFKKGIWFTVGGIVLTLILLFI